jgi:hypothetical protein
VKKLGTAGPQGPAGPGGAKGAKGDKGDNGAAGVNGTNGSNGVSGINGANGEDGMCSEANPECSLASGGVLTGVWGVANTATTQSFTPELSAITFPVRVSPPPTTLVTKEFSGFKLGLEISDGKAGFYGPGQNFLTEEEIVEDEEAFAAACPGNVAEPQAAPGFLCIYRGAEEGPNSAEVVAGGAEAAGSSGVVVPWQVGAETNARGTWAVTAE